MRQLLAILIAVCVAPMAGLVGGQPDRGSEFEYARTVKSEFVERVEAERSFAGSAGTDGDAQRWAVTVSLLLEIAQGALGPVERAFALDAALIELTRSESRRLIENASPDRVRALRTSLSRFGAEDPAGFRDEVQRLARTRIRAIERRVMSGPEPSIELDGLLSETGWTAAGDRGPRGRQRAKDRADFRAFERQDIAAIEGMARRHAFLPPTEALQAVPLPDLEYRLQRSRNFVRRLDDLWVHQDGPRVHDFVLDFVLRDATGITRLVHADTTLLAQHDRLRRWRLREALWRLERGR